MVEKPSADDAPSNLCITGRYILSTEIFDYLDKGVRGAGGEIQLTDAIADNLGKMPIHAVRFSGRRFDCGSKEGFVAANLHFAHTRKSRIRSSEPRLKSCSDRAEFPASPY